MEPRPWREFFGEDEIRRALNTIDARGATTKLETLTDWHLRRAFNEACELLQREAVLRDIARSAGQSPSSPHLATLPEFGLAIVAFMAGHDRGLREDPRIARRVLKGISVAAHTLRAEADGKLLPMKKDKTR